MVRLGSFGFLFCLRRRLDDLRFDRDVMPPVIKSSSDVLEWLRPSENIDASDVADDDLLRDGEFGIDMGGVGAELDDSPAVGTDGALDCFKSPLLLLVTASSL
jgi:hypothetical protein